MNTARVSRVKIHLPPDEHGTTIVRGVASQTVCVLCGQKLRGKTHAEARKALRLHRLDQHTDDGARG